MNVRSVLCHRHLVSVLKEVGPYSYCFCIDSVCSVDLHQASVNVDESFSFFMEEFNHKPDGGSLCNSLGAREPTRGRLLETQQMDSRGSE